MKKVVVAIAVCLVAWTSMQAQNEEYKLTLGATVGYSLTGALLNSVDNAFGDISVGSTPALQLSVDYGLNNWFSIGLAGSLQNFDFDIPEYSFTDDAGDFQTEAVNIDFNRTTIAIRPLFHYANSDNIDMYSGLRIQLVNRGFNIDSTDENLDTETVIGVAEGSRIGVGIVAYGVRYYFTDNIGAGLEIMWGAPYVASLSVNARF